MRYVRKRIRHYVYNNNNIRTSSSQSSFLFLRCASDSLPLRRPRRPTTYITYDVRASKRIQIELFSKFD
jgi:hypothetical protein